MCVYVWCVYFNIGVKTTFHEHTLKEMINIHYELFLINHAR